MEEGLWRIDSFYILILVWDALGIRRKHCSRSYQCDHEYKAAMLSVTIVQQVILALEFVYSLVIRQSEGFCLNAMFNPCPHRGGGDAPPMSFSGMAAKWLGGSR